MIISATLPAEEMKQSQKVFSFWGKIGEKLSKINWGTFGELNQNH